jgi:hypothetical protein
LVDQTFFQWLIGNEAKANSSSALSRASSRAWELAAQHPGDHVQLLMDMGGVGLGEDRADRRGDHLR